MSLYIVCDSEWSGSDAQLESLQRKIHNYVSFAIDGPMTAAYPETDGLAWQIVIDSQRGLPDERTRAALSQVGQAVTRYGGDLVVREHRDARPGISGPGRYAGGPGASALRA